MSGEPTSLSCDTLVDVLIVENPRRSNVVVFDVVVRGGDCVVNFHRFVNLQLVSDQIAESRVTRMSGVAFIKANFSFPLDEPSEKLC